MKFAFLSTTSSITLFLVNCYRFTPRQFLHPVKIFCMTPLLFSDLVVNTCLSCNLPCNVHAYQIHPVCSVFLLDQPYSVLKMVQIALTSRRSRRSHSSDFHLSKSNSRCILQVLQSWFSTSPAMAMVDTKPLLLPLSLS